VQGEEEERELKNSGWRRGSVNRKKNKSGRIRGSE
jgi:hypothetical protein